MIVLFLFLKSTGHDKQSTYRQIKFRTPLTKNRYSCVRDVLVDAFVLAIGDVGDVAGDGLLAKMFSQENDPTFTSEIQTLANCRVSLLR